MSLGRRVVYSVYCRARCANLGALQGKFAEDVNEAMLAHSKKLTAVKDQKEADEIVLNAMKKGSFVSMHSVCVRVHVPLCVCGQFAMTMHHAWWLRR